MRSPTFPPRRPSTIFRYLLPFCILFICFFYLTDLGARDPAKGAGPHVSLPWPSSRASSKDGHTRLSSFGDLGNEGLTASPGEKHPIDTLISISEKEFDKMLSHTSRSLSEAAAAYRKRRGRHPPPGFKDWYDFAKERNTIVVEGFWDQIYQDLEPFWALPPAMIRKGGWDFEMSISIRNNSATASSDWFWTQIWLSLIQSIEHLLPDMDIALNAMDEPRIVVPWEQINAYLKAANRKKQILSPQKVVTEYQKLPAPGEGTDRAQIMEEKNWERTRPYWLVARRGCDPTSPARKTETMRNFNHTPVISNELAGPHMYQGYVANYTLSTDICHQSDLQGLNGIFVEPLSVSATKVLFPLFGGSKLGINNEILLPAPMYWSEEERFMAGGETGIPWSWKEDKAMWRGVATGGKNRESNWRAFQRHRFVAMNNGTKLKRAEERTEPPANFALPGGSYGLKAKETGRLGPWVDTWSDVSFVDLMCFPERDNGQCNYTGSHFSVTDTVKMAQQFNSKYLPDIDGNSFSGRYLSFLRSTSLPIKATVWREWHDSRLVAWKHFVPMDNRYGDWYGIMEYFLGHEDDLAGHDAVAERIAAAGKEWADKVMRKEDMQVYVLRLLLEYARVCDERRESMGWVGDLLPGKERNII